MTEIIRCVSCDGFGWLDDEDEGEIECRWCAGVGYVYRDANGIDRKIPPTDWEAVNGQLETLEQQRLRELGYTGTAKKPWEQEIRKRN